MPTLTEKIIKAHLQEGTMDRGCPIAIKIDQDFNTRCYRNYGLFTIRSYGCRPS